MDTFPIQTECVVGDSTVANVEISMCAVILSLFVSAAISAVLS